MHNFQVMETTGSTVSLWMGEKPEQSPEEIPSRDKFADTCIIGAGIAGLTTAYFLAKEKKDVIVLDQLHPGAGETSRTTAHLSAAIDDFYVEIERLHGTEGARLAAQSHARAIDLIEEICRNENIICDFRRLPGYLFLGKDGTLSLLERELAAARRAGISVEWQASLPFRSLSDGPCLLFPNQGQFHPTQYLNGLTAAIKRHGGRIYSKIHVTNIESGTCVQIITADGTQIRANSVLVATNSPINDRFYIHTKQMAYRTYVAAFEVQPGTLPSALFWDTEDPYHYVRSHFTNGHEYAIIGGEDHKTGQSHNEADRHLALEGWAREHIPQVKNAAFKWSGQIEETIDGLAFIGRNPDDFPNIYIATGDSGMGMTHGTIAGRLVSDLILGNQNEWEILYDPSRKTLGALTQWLKENANTALQYKDHFTAGEIDSHDDLKNGEGAILRRGLRKLAIYRDPAGKFHQLSAVCPHLGGIVHWNRLEKTWDCPCHGSRFSPTGEVIAGPAVCGLEPSDYDARVAHDETERKAG